MYHSRSLVRSTRAALSLREVLTWSGSLRVAQKMVQRACLGTCGMSEVSGAAPVGFAAAAAAAAPAPLAATAPSEGRSTGACGRRDALDAAGLALAVSAAPARVWLFCDFFWALDGSFSPHETHT